MLTATHLVHSRRARFAATIVTVLAASACSTAVDEAPQDTSATAAAIDTSPIAQQIRKVYADTLARSPNDWEVSVWKSNIQGGGWTLASMRAAFVRDDQCKTAIVRVYTDVFERTPLDWEINAWRNKLLVGGSIANMRDDFAHSDEARGKIIAIYQQVLFRTPEAWEIAAWQTNLSINRWSLVGMRAAFASSTLDKGGLHLAANGTKLVITQGIVGSKLVAGKHVFMATFMSVADAARINSITYTVRDAGGHTSTQTVAAWSMIRLNGEASGVELAGSLFPRAGKYTVTMTFDAVGGTVATIGSTQLSFVPAKDIHLMVSMVVKPNRPGLIADASWYSELADAMNRLNAMLPVRDGVATLNADRKSGLRYATEECNGFDGGIPYQDCTYQPVRAINASSGDHIDVVIEWRPGVYSGVNQTDYSPGGNSAPPPAPYADLRRGNCVSGAWGGVFLDGTCIAQEIGHNFGLEPPGSPHYNDPNDPGHSKDGPLGDPYAYDFVHHRPLAVGPFGFSGDTMNNSAGGSSQGQDAAAYNAYDFNYLIDQLANLPGTGSETNP